MSDYHYLPGAAEIPRRTAAVVDEYLGGFRAVVVNGPRQAGKSTLVHQVQQSRGRVVTLDDPVQLDLARKDPVGFLQQMGPTDAIDEFQRGGESLLLALKQRLDRRRERGQMLLAGSTRFLTTRRLAETLTGRIGIVELLPLSAGEIRGVHEGFLDAAFTGLPIGELRCESLRRVDYAELLAVGGFPELAIERPSTRVRSGWCRSYLDTVTAPSNVAQVGETRRLDIPLSLLSQLAARSSGEIITADLGRELSADQATIRVHLDLLETLYLIRILPGWTTSRTTRAKRRGVVHLIDTALACHLLGETADGLGRIESPWFGPLLESFVASEVAKQAGWSEIPTAIMQYRDRDQREVDIVLERPDGIVAIEVKATATPSVAHAKYLAYIRERLGQRFRLGLVLHTGDQQVWLGDRIAALPVSALWAPDLSVNQPK